MAASTKKAIFVIGPTAGGKSAWALEQAESYGGSIINIDSVQFYRGLEVGSAAPTAAEKTRVPHYLYSYVQAPAEMTAGRYVDDFYKLLENPLLQFPIFIVGGTGFYVQALEKGLFDIAPVPAHYRLQLEKELADRGAESLHGELRAEDPHSRIHVNDHYRLLRALEIIRATGKTPTQMKAEQDYKKSLFPFPYIKAGFSFEKDVFAPRVQNRTAAMIENGLIEETRAFMSQGFENWAPLSSVGFKETTQFLRENKTKGWLQENIMTSTMQLIKKQKTWFKKDASVLWSQQTEHLKQFVLGD